MYLTYEEYTEQGGTLQEAAFCRLERKARWRIDHLTLNRLKCMEMVPEEIVFLVSDLIPLFSVLEEMETGQHATSYSNDGVSVNYAGISYADVSASIDQMIFDVCARLETADGTPLLYRGCDA
ncbi:MAG: hypothetical protein IJE10_11220 [Clostridia bacterium]|nr:hypothetical protein [Clostridia bacterium]